SHHRYEAWRDLEGDVLRWGWCVRNGNGTGPDGTVRCSRRYRRYGCYRFAVGKAHPPRCRGLHGTLRLHFGGTLFGTILGTFVGVFLGTFFGDFLGTLFGIFLGTFRRQHQRATATLTETIIGRTTTPSSSSPSPSPLNSGFAPSFAPGFTASSAGGGEGARSAGGVARTGGRDRC
ncbi:unnamed protein product, partial [Laminaria digitata]